MPFKIARGIWAAAVGVRDVRQHSLDPPTATVFVHDFWIVGRICTDQWLGSVVTNPVGTDRPSPTRVIATKESNVNSCVKRWFNGVTPIYYGGLVLIEKSEEYRQSVRDTRRPGHCA